METGTLVILLLAGSIVFGSYTAFVADEKGYSGKAWFAGGFFFWLIALIAVAGLPKKGP